MTTDKPRWWQSWIVYALAVLVALLGPYVGAYYLLSAPRYYPGFEFHHRNFDFEFERMVFVPLGWAEAKIRGEKVIFSTTDGDKLVDYVSYEPGW